MHKPESVQENEMHKILTDFEIEKTRLSFTCKKERTCHLEEVSVRVEHRIK